MRHSDDGRHHASEIRAAPGRIVYGPNPRLPRRRSPIDAVNHNCPCPNNARRPALSSVSESLVDPHLRSPMPVGPFNTRPRPRLTTNTHTLRTPQSPKSQQAEPPKAKPPPPPLQAQTMPGANDERSSLLRSASTGPKPMYLAPRSNSIRHVRACVCRGFGRWTRAIAGRFDLDTGSTSDVLCLLLLIPKWDRWTSSRWSAPPRSPRVRTSHPGAQQDAAASAHNG